MSEPVLLVEDVDAVRRLILNRPAKLNALNSELSSVLSGGLTGAALDEAVRVVVIAGAGRSFCAGYDLNEETADGSPLESLTGSLENLLEIFDHPKPIIAEVRGHCLAGGCDLMMMCDLAVASDDAIFGQPEIRFGSTVVAHVMPWLVGARRAKELVLTGRDDVTADEAYRIGLVNRVVPMESLQNETMRLAAQLAVVDPTVMALTKRAINRSWEVSGFRQALIDGVELGAEIETARSPEREEFDRLAAEQGLKEAIRWRDARFGS
jgi:enoyl-CoA hydratase/carnithine racemase